MSNIPEKYFIEIHANGDFNEELIGMITNHNEGKGEIKGFNTFIKYMEAKKCLRGNSTYDFKYNTSTDDKQLFIYEKDKRTLTISYNTFKK